MYQISRPYATTHFYLTIFSQYLDAVFFCCGLCESQIAEFRKYWRINHHRKKQSLCAREITNLNKVFERETIAEMVIKRGVSITQGELLWLIHRRVIAAAAAAVDDFLNGASTHQSITISFCEYARVYVHLTAESIFHLYGRALMISNITR